MQINIPDEFVKELNEHIENECGLDPIEPEDWTEIVIYLLEYEYDFKR